MSDKIYRPLVLVFLAVLIIAVAAAAVLPILQENSRRARCQDALDTADLPGLLADYEDAVYNDPRVNNINQQSFLANEYQFQAQILTASLIAACAP